MRFIILRFSRLLKIVFMHCLFITIQFSNSSTNWHTRMQVHTYTFINTGQTGFSCSYKFQISNFFIFKIRIKSWIMFAYALHIMTRFCIFIWENWIFNNYVIIIKITCTNNSKGRSDPVCLWPLCQTILYSAWTCYT